MANLVGVQPVLVPLMGVQSHDVRVALWSLGIDIDTNDQVDLDLIDQQKLKAEIKKQRGE